MANVTALGSLKGRLCGELAAALARRLTKSGHRGDSFYHDSTSAFEAATAALTKFGVLAPVPRADRPGEIWYCLHELTIDAADMPNYLAPNIHESEIHLSELLEAFLSVFGYYDYLPDRREFFSAPEYLVSSLKMLAKTGFAERLGDQFRWTDQIGPAMQATSLWDENFISTSDADTTSFEEDARLAWQTMPELLKVSIRSGQVTFVQFVKILALGWKEGRWVAYRLDDRATLKGETMLAQRIFELAAKGK